MTHARAMEMFPFEERSSVRTDRCRFLIEERSLYAFHRKGIFLPPPSLFQAVYAVPWLHITNRRRRGIMDGFRRRHGLRAIEAAVALLFAMLATLALTTGSAWAAGASMSKTAD